MKKIIMPILTLSIIQFILYMNYGLIIDKYITGNILFIKAINTYSIIIFLSMIIFVIFISIIRNKIYFEEYIEDNRHIFINALLASIIYSLLAFFISLFSLIYQTKIIINLMIVMFVLETVYFIILTIVEYRFIKCYLDK